MSRYRRGDGSSKKGGRNQGRASGRHGKRSRGRNSGTWAQARIDRDL